MFRGFRQIVGITLISRVFGLVREIAFAHFFGAGALLDSWFIAFKIPNLSRRIFGEGAASASFIPVYSQELHGDKEKARRLACTTVTAIAMILSVAVVVGWLGIAVYSQTVASAKSETKLVLALSSIMLPYMVMICVVAILSGILNVHKHFAMPAAAPIILNIFIIGSTVASAKLLGLESGKQVFVIAVSVLVAGVVQLSMQFIPLRKEKIKIRPCWDVKSDAFKKMLLLMGPMILGLTVTQLNTLADDIIAWTFSGSSEKGEFINFLGQQLKFPLMRGSVAHLNFAQRLYQFPLGVLGISLATAIFPVMSAKAAQKDYKGLCDTISKGFKIAVALAVPATLGLILVSDTLVSLLFEHGEFDARASQLTSWTLLFYSMGLCGFFSQQIMTRAFYSLQDSKAPAITAVIAVTVNIILNLTLIWPLGTAGLALSTAICSYLQIVILACILKHNPVMDGLFATAVKAMLASVAMYFAGLAVLHFSEPLGYNKYCDAVRLGLVVAVCGLVYFVMAKLLNISQVKALMKRRTEN